MPRFLRDLEISDVNITAESLSRLTDILFDRLVQMPEFESTENPKAILVITIRFDEKGYRVFSKQDLLKYFDEANEVERIIFDLSSFDAINSNKVNGSYLELRLDKHQDIRCFLTSSSDDENWMNCSFTSVSEVLRSYSNKNNLLRGSWAELLIQLAGVLAGFILSLWGASKIAPNLHIENAFLISFLLVLLIFSNLWALIGRGIRGIIYKSFPKIKFYRKGKAKLQWLIQGLITGFFVAVALYLINLGFNYIGKMLGMFIGSGT